MTNFISSSGDNIFDDNIFSATDIGEYDHTPQLILMFLISSSENK